MARIGKLTALDVTRAKGPAALHDGGGLYLRVSATGAKSWVFRFQLDGRRRDMGLGPYPAISLAEARGRAAEHRKQRHDGIDPLAAKADRRQAQRLDAARAMTFEKCAEAHIAAHKAGWRDGKHEAQWRQSLTDYVFPVFGALSVQSVHVGLVLKALEPIWTAKPETASRVRGRIESVIDWATARGYRRGENPARWRGHLENLLPKKSKVRGVAHYAALPYPETGAFMAELRQEEGVAPRALEFLILTAARSSEVRGARWDEINMAERAWTIPRERMKAGKEHRAPLSDAALTIVRKMAEIRQGDFVFPGIRAGRPIGKLSYFLVLRRMGRGDLTAHGFRSTFRDWVAESTAFPTEVAEMALAHTVGAAVERAYRRGDLFQKRRQMMDAWAHFCDGRPVGGEVVPIRAWPDSIRNRGG
jgi:integrase